jgi:hypothetical protein
MRTKDLESKKCTILGERRGRSLAIPRSGKKKRSKKRDTIG